MARTLRMRRSQTAASGMLLVLLGVWGGLIPFIGPYFHYAYTPDKAWDYTTARLWLEILPGAAALVGGALLVTARGRMAAAFGAALAAAAGAWFTLGTVLRPAVEPWPAAGRHARRHHGRLADRRAARLLHRPRRGDRGARGARFRPRHRLAGGHGAPDPVDDDDAEVTEPISR